MVIDGDEVEVSSRVQKKSDYQWPLKENKNCLPHDIDEN